MTSSDGSGRRSVAELNRRLLEQAYPEKDPEWIQQQADLTVQRLSETPSDEPLPRAPAARQGIRTSFLVVPLVVAAIAIIGLAATRPDSFARIFVGTGGIVGLTVCAALAAAVTGLTYVRSRLVPLLSCRVRIDARWASDVGGMVQLRRPDGTPIADPSVVVARIKNMGGAPIERDDYLDPLVLSFPGREVVTVDVTESDPVDLQDEVPYDPGFRMESDRITLPRVALQPEDSFKMVVVLSGPTAGHQTAIDGRLRKGSITTEQSPRRIRRTTILSGAVTAVIVGALVVASLLNYASPFAKRPADVVCVPGTLTVEGSSAFALAATKSAGSYTAYCSQVAINIYSPGSLVGLADLHRSTPAERQQLLALSDGMADHQAFPELMPHALAVLPYTFVVNDKAPVTSLTIDQVRRIFTGRATHWSDITGNPRDNEEIRVIGRTGTSGTRQTLETRVIGTPAAPVRQAPPNSDSCLDRRPDVPQSAAIVCEQATTDELVNKVGSVDYSIGYADLANVAHATGVKEVQISGLDGTLSGIQAGYPFWTVEYVYSAGTLPPHSLPTAFINYLGSSNAAAAIKGFQYYPCQPSDPVVTLLCQSGR